MLSVEDLNRLLRQRTWDKECNLWVGPEKQLLTALQGVHTESIDLLDLFDQDNLPIEDDDVRQHLARSLRQKLRSMPATSHQHRVLIVRSAGLLARYEVGTREFYDWYCDDFSMVLLLIEGRSAESRWPDEVDCDPDRLISSFVDASLIKQQFCG